MEKRPPNVKRNAVAVKIYYPVFHDSYEGLIKLAVVVHFYLDSNYCTNMTIMTEQFITNTILNSSASPEYNGQANPWAS